MQLLIQFFKTFILVAIATLHNPKVGIAATQIPIPKNYVLVQIHGKYATQTTKIFNYKKKWVCQTEDLPYFEAKKNPLEEIRWTNLEAEEKNQSSANCRDHVLIQDRRTKPFKVVSGCLSSPDMTKTIDVINKLCGRF